MKVLLLTPRPELLIDAVQAEGDSYVVSMEAPDLWPTDVDFLVSFGYRHIIPPFYLNHYSRRAINLHISLLPWNRGAHPNFWSWFDRTPKGVSIHVIDDGIDTGGILAQLPVEEWPRTGTLRSTHATLITKAALLFSMQWQKIRRLTHPLDNYSKGGGSYHRIGDIDQWMGKLSRGWDTPVREVEELGAASKGN